MKAILKKGIAWGMIVAMAFSIAGINPKTKTIQAKESTEYTIKVNLGTNCTTIYKKGKAVKAMICSPSAETPTGTFYVPVKYRWHEMIGNCYAQYCTRITTGVLFHSVWYYKNGDKSTMSVSAYNVMGQKASHGCVRLLCKDAKWIYDHCAVGTKIVIFWGNKKDDPLKRPSFTPIRTGAFTSWDPTDPDPKNPYRKSLPTITAKTKKIEYKAKVKVLDLVSIKGSTGDNITKSNGTIKTSGKINTKKLGKYTVQYKVKDSLGKKKTKKITFKVVDTKKPIINGAVSKKNVPMGSTVNLMSGVKAKMISGKNITSKVKVSVKYKKKKVKVKNKTVTFTQAGKYKITYTVKAANKQTRTKTVTYKVTDQRLKMALTTASVTLKQNDKFDPYQYIRTLTTYKGVNLDKKTYVKCIGKVDTTKPGTYTIQYVAQYKNLKYTAVTAKLKVIVQKAPTVTTQEETTTLQNQTTAPSPETTTPSETVTPEETESVPESTNRPVNE